VIGLKHHQLLVQAHFLLAQCGDTPADGSDMLTDAQVKAVTVDGEIAPSTSVSKPCVP
jgi:hypothetical protein